MLFSKPYHIIKSLILLQLATKDLTEPVVKEIMAGLKAHELIKIQVLGDDRQARVNLFEEICKVTGAAPINHIGKLLIIYQPSDKNLIRLPD